MFDAAVFISLDNLSQFIKDLLVFFTFSIEELEVGVHIVICHFAYAWFLSAYRFEDLLSFFDSVLQLKIEGKLQSQLRNEFKVVEIVLDILKVLMQQHMQESLICFLQLNIKNLFKSLSSLVFSASSNLENSLINDWEVLQVVILFIIKVRSSHLEQSSVDWFEDVLRQCFITSSSM